MKGVISNTGYFCKEALTMLRQSLLSNVLSIFSTCLIFFILAMVFAGWWSSNHVVDVIQGQAEISVFYPESSGNPEIKQLTEKIQGLGGVQDVKTVDKTQAYNQMVEILGDQATILKIFDQNPFSPYIEVHIDLNHVDTVLEELNHLPNIDHVRNNQAVLDRLRNITGMMRLFGLVVFVAVAVSTLVITSQIIRLGIQNNREQINTLRFLGAPEPFIALPFLLEGLLLTGGGGLLAVALAARVLKQAYAQIAGQLSFIPLLPSQTLMSGMIAVVMGLSVIIGIGGSLVGLTTAKGR